MDKDSASVAIIISMLTASVISFQIGSEIANLFGMLFGIVGIITTLSFIKVALRKVGTGYKVEGSEESIKKYERITGKLIEEGKLSKEQIQLAEEVLKKSR